MTKRIAAGDGASLITLFGLYLLLWPQQSQGQCSCKAERLADQFDTQRRRVLTVKQLRKTINQKVENAVEFNYVFGFVAQEM